MKADDKRTVLSFHNDFLNEQIIVEHYIQSRGQVALFLPKFHCELNPIERVWGYPNHYCRAHTNFTLPTLRQTINPALDSVSLELIRFFFTKARDYERAYNECIKAGRKVEEVVK